MSLPTSTAKLTPATGLLKKSLGQRLAGPPASTSFSWSISQAVSSLLMAQVVPLKPLCPSSSPWAETVEPLHCPETAQHCATVQVGAAQSAGWFWWRAGTKLWGAPDIVRYLGDVQWPQVGLMGLRMFWIGRRLCAHIFVCVFDTRVKLHEWFDRNSNERIPGIVVSLPRRYFDLDNLSSQSFVKGGPCSKCSTSDFGSLQALLHGHLGLHVNRAYVYIYIYATNVM